MKQKLEIKQITESIELAKKLEKKTNQNLLWFLLIPIAFGLGWLSFSISSINRINDEKNIIEDDKIDLATLLEERDSLLLVIKSLKQRDSVISSKDSAIIAAINSTLRLDKQDYSNNWGIITGADNSLASAEWEVDRLKKIGINNAIIFGTVHKCMLI